jgi:hypothetical protein
VRSIVEREFWRTFAVLGEDDDLGQTCIKGKNRFVADSAERERERERIVV